VKEVYLFLLLFLNSRLLKKPKKSYNKSRDFQDTWATQFPWAQVNFRPYSIGLEAGEEEPIIEAH
jgi:hypothetical protein